MPFSACRLITWRLLFPLLKMVHCRLWEGRRILHEKAVNSRLMLHSMSTGNSKHLLPDWEKPEKMPPKVEFPPP